jgi:predicted O-methyltransferase YrrM
MTQFGETICSAEVIQQLNYLLTSVKDLKGSVAEIGVYKGGTALVIANMLPNDDIYLYDTFEGMPEVCEFDNTHKKGDFNDTSFIGVSNLFKDKKNVKVIKGIFPKENVDFLKDKKFKFVHLDVDIYESYKESLDFFHDKMIPGGVMLFDDYNAWTCLGSKKAIDEYVSKYNLKLHFGKDFQAYLLY